MKVVGLCAACLAWCLDVACCVLKGDDEKVPEEGSKQPVTEQSPQKWDLKVMRG